MKEFISPYLTGFLWVQILIVDQISISGDVKP